MKTHEYVPQVAQGYVDELDGRGLPCRVESNPRAVKVICESGRVKATAEFRRQGGRWRHVDGVLTIDGLRCNTVPNFDELERVLADPDRWLEASLSGDELEKLREVREVALPPEPSEHVDPADPAVPAEVRHCVMTLAHGLATVPDASAVLEHPEPGVWQIRMGREGLPKLVFVFVRHGRSWGISGIILVRPGFDWGLDMGRSMEQALTAVGGPSMAGVDKVVGSPGQAPRGKNDQIRAKVNTVIRT